MKVYTEQRLGFLRKLNEMGGKSSMSEAMSKVSVSE